MRTYRCVYKFSASSGFADLFFRRKLNDEKDLKLIFLPRKKSLLKRILAAIGALYVGIGMGLVMGMGWDEGGGLCLL